MPITRTPMVDDDGSGTTGTVLNNAWKQEFYNQIDTLVGIWTPIPFNAANYTAAPAGTWVLQASDQTTLQYIRIGQFVTIAISIASSTITGTPTWLQIALPFMASKEMYSLGRAYLGGWQAMIALTEANGSQAKFGLLSGANWSAVTDGVYVQATLITAV